MILIYNIILGCQCFFKKFCLITRVTISMAKKSPNKPLKHTSNAIKNTSKMPKKALKAKNNNELRKNVELKHCFLPKNYFIQIKRYKLRSMIFKI